MTSLFAFARFTLNKRAMIVKTNQGYQVVSEEGRNLTPPNLTREEAVKREYQVGFFKPFLKKQQTQ